MIKQTKAQRLRRLHKGKLAKAKKEVPIHSMDRLRQLFVLLRKHEGVQNSHITFKDERSVEDSVARYKMLRIQINLLLQTIKEHK